MANLYQKLPILNDFGVKPTIIKWQRWNFVWGSRPGTLFQCQIF